MPVTGYLSDAADADQAAPGFDPMQPAFANPLAFAPEPPEEEPETMLTEVDHDRLDPMLLTGTVAEREPNAEELLAAATRAEQGLDLGDRAGAYLELYQVTGNEQLLLQAQIMTCSGALGGMALEGNFRAKMANPDDYQITLDKFSNDIDRAIIKLAKDEASAGFPENFTKMAILQTDREVWRDNQMPDDFPVNAQLIGEEGYEDIANTVGSRRAILAQDEMELGRRPAQYAADEDYAIHESEDGRFVIVCKENAGYCRLYGGAINENIMIKSIAISVDDIENWKTYQDKGRELVEAAIVDVQPVEEPVADQSE